MIDEITKRYDIGINVGFCEDADGNEAMLVILSRVRVSLSIDKIMEIKKSIRDHFRGIGEERFVYFKVTR